MSARRGTRRQTRRTCTLRSSSSMASGSGGRGRPSIRIPCSRAESDRPARRTTPAASGLQYRACGVPRRMRAPDNSPRLPAAADRLNVRTMRRSACVLLCAMTAVAWDAPIAAQGRRARDPQIDNLIADARTLPAEFSADALIRLAGLPQVSNATKVALLDEAFQLAHSARDDYRMSTVPEVPDDTRQGAQRQAYATGLSRVSLQARAAQQMAFTDPRRGRELFEWIDLNVSPTACEGPLVPVVDEYYTTLSYVARTTFGLNRAEGLWFLEFYLWRAHLPSEVPAVARAVQRFRPRPDEAVYLQTVVRMILQGGRTDARGFSTATLDIVQRMADLQKPHRDLGVAGW